MVENAHNNTFWEDTRGRETLEWVILGGFIIVGIAVMTLSFGDSVESIFGHMAGAMDAVRFNLWWW